MRFIFLFKIQQNLLEVQVFMFVTFRTFTNIGLRYIVTERGLLLRQVFCVSQKALLSEIYKIR